MDNNFYCSQKFDSLTIDLLRYETGTCPCDDPVKIDIDWLKKNPGQLHNIPQKIKDRQDMLENIPAASCEKQCWAPKRSGLPSRQILMNTQIRTSIDTECDPKYIVVNLGNLCNLTCSYCCKQYSHSWANDLKKNGPYNDSDRYNLTTKDQIIIKLKQNKSTAYDYLLNEISQYQNIDKLSFTGGEPLLYTGLVDLINRFSQVKTIGISTGLGLPTATLKKILDGIDNISNVTMSVSCEGLDEFYEFNRFGNSYGLFTDNLNLLKLYGVKILIMSVVSNLTIFGLIEFQKEYKEYPIRYQFCNDPDFMHLSVLDSDSKKLLIDQFIDSNISVKSEIIEALQMPYSAETKTTFCNFVIEFAKRRNLSLDIFPATLVKWIKEGQYVV